MSVDAVTPPTIVMLTDVDTIIQPGAMVAHVPHPSPTASKKQQDIQEGASALQFGPFDVEAARSKATAEADGRFIELYQAARKNAPRCNGVPLQWMTISQMAATLQISKSCISNWATRQYIVSLKGPGKNQHRYVHLDNTLAFIQDQVLRDADWDSAI